MGERPIVIYLLSLLLSLRAWWHTGLSGWADVHWSATGANSVAKMRTLNTLNAGPSGPSLITVQEELTRPSSILGKICYLLFTLYDMWRKTCSITLNVMTHNIYIFEQFLDENYLCSCRYFELLLFNYLHVSRAFVVCNCQFEKPKHLRGKSLIVNKLLSFWWGQNKKKNT